jgi:hypothetical protein
VTALAPLTDAELAEIEAEIERLEHARLEVAHDGCDDGGDYYDVLYDPKEDLADVARRLLAEVRRLRAELDRVAPWPEGVNVC